MHREEPAWNGAQELEAVYRSNVRRVYGFARNRVGESEAEEIVGEVFYAAALAFRRGDGGTVSPSWLMAVTKNKVNDHWRRSYRRKAKRHLSHLGRDELVTFPDHWTADPRRPNVLAALDQLPEKDRAILVLHHVDGMRIAALAESMNKSVAAVESALARARRKFRYAYTSLEESNGRP